MYDNFHGISFQLWFVDSFSDIGFVFRIGASVKMEHHFQAALDPRKQELLEARFIGARVSFKKKKNQISRPLGILQIIVYIIVLFSTRYNNIIVVLYYF